MEVPVSIFRESPLAGEPRERLFHIHSVHRYQLCAKYIYPSTLLWQINCYNLQQQPGMIHWCYLFRCWKCNDVKLNIGVFCASCARSLVVDGSAFSFADVDVVCSTSLMASLIMKHERPARCRASRSVKQSSGLQKDYKFKFKYFIASYTWQGVYRGSCNKVSHTHTRTKT